MRRITDYVWCDYYGSVHDNNDDPEQEGPAHAADNSYEESWWDETIWTLEDRKDGYGLVWHFKCPGPHFKIWQGAGL